MFSPEQYKALHESTGLIDHSSRGRLMLTGRDRRAYLQGLLTNDIDALAPGTGCYAAYLTAQGRMIADVRLFELGDALLADLEGDVTSAVRDRWDMFIFSEDVQIADVTASTAQIGVYGPGAAHTLSRVIGAADGSAGPTPQPGMLDGMPLLACKSWSFRGATVHVLRRNDAGVMGFDVVLPLERKGELMQQLQELGGTPVESATVEASRIEAGIPVFGQDMTADTIPLEAGIEDRAISLTKGCYVGQEIIIRVLHRGHGRVARKLVGLTFEPGAGPEPGGRISSSDGRDIGSVTSAAMSPALERPIALGYVHRDFVSPGTVVTVKQGDTETAATVTPLPFVA